MLPVLFAAYLAAVPRSAHATLLFDLLLVDWASVRLRSHVSRRRFTPLAR